MSHMGEDDTTILGLGQAVSFRQTDEEEAPLLGNSQLSPRGSQHTFFLLHHQVYRSAGRNRLLITRASSRSRAHPLWALNSHPQLQDQLDDHEAQHLRPSGCASASESTKYTTLTAYP